MSATAPETTSAVSLPLPANDNLDFGKHTLPALQRAARGDLMPEGESNEIAAITLARLWRIFSGEAIVETIAIPGRPKAQTARYDSDEIDGTDERGNLVMKPMDTQLVNSVEFADEDDPERDDKDRDIIENLKIRITRRNWYNRSDGTISRIAIPSYWTGAEWLEYKDDWGDVRSSVTFMHGYRIRQPKLDSTREDLKDLDALDRQLFRDMMGEDLMRVVELFVAGATMKGIGAAFSFKGKPAEAVGLDRIRSAVRRAQYVFGEIEKARRQDYPWQVDPAVAMHFPRTRRMAA